MILVGARDEAARDRVIHHDTRRSVASSGMTSRQLSLLHRGRLRHYDHRFRTFKNDLEIMNRVWNGEPVNGGTLSIWPGCNGGPPTKRTKFSTPSSILTCLF
jgi:hypothetical protein